MYQKSAVETRMHIFLVEEIALIQTVLLLKMMQLHATQSS